MKYADFLKKHHGKAGLDHVVDFLKAKGFDKKNINFSFEQAQMKAHAWVEELTKEAKNSGQVEVLENIGPYQVVKLLDETARQWEGHHLKHCVSSDEYKDSTLISLRDENNIPHCTIDFTGGTVKQIKGRRNGRVLVEPAKAVIEYLVKTQVDLSKVVLTGDIKNLNLFGLHTELKEVFSWVREEYPVYKSLIFKDDYVFVNKPLQYKEGVPHKRNFVELMIRSEASSEEVKTLMADGFDPSNNNLILRVAIEMRKRDLVKTLLNSQFKFRITDESVLHEAIVNDDIVLMKELIKYGFKAQERAKQYILEEIKQEFLEAEYIYSLSDREKKAILTRQISAEEFKMMIPKMCHFTVYEIFLKLVEGGQEEFAQILLPEVVEGQIIRSMDQRKTLKKCIEYGFSDLLKKIFLKLEAFEKHSLQVNNQRPYYDRTLEVLVDLKDTEVVKQFLSLRGYDPKFDSRQGHFGSSSYFQSKGILLKELISLS